jgi:aspartyl-tRNA(Asn)/glutamyl-tRNA(Gln) amidotransferase subunit C
MTLSRDDVDHVATLGRLGLTDDEKNRLLGELEKILGHIARLQQVDTSMLAETAQVGDLVNVMRDDEPEPPIGSVAALGNAPVVNGGYFTVGAIQGAETDV